MNTSGIATADGLGADDTKQRLLDAAVQLLDERPPERVRLRDISDRTGLTTGAVYWFYRDRGALIDAAIVERWARRTWAAIEDGRSNIDAVLQQRGAAQLGSFLMAAFAPPADRIGARERILVLAAAERDAEIAARVRATQRGVVEVVSTSLRLLMEHGLVRQDIDPGSLATGICALVLGLEMLDVPSDVGPGTPPFQMMMGLLFALFTESPATPGE